MQSLTTNNLQSDTLTAPVSLLCLGGHKGRYVPLIHDLDMTRELAKIPPRKLSRTGRPQLPTTIAKAGEKAGHRFIEFFTANIRNRNTRLAYARAVGPFFEWC